MDLNLLFHLMHEHMGTGSEKVSIADNDKFRALRISGVFYVIFIDSEGIPTLRCNVRALQDNTYRLAGEMLATMTGQGGPLPQMFDGSAIKYMVSGIVEPNPKVEDLPRVIGEALNKVCKGLYKVH